MFLAWAVEMAGEASRPRIRHHPGHGPFIVIVGGGLSGIHNTSQVKLTGMVYAGDWGEEGWEDGAVRRMKERQTDIQTGS